MDEQAVLSIAELAERGGVSRRTVRYYVQRGLLPAPAGRGRGDHYGPEHLTTLLRIRGWQEQGVSLEAIAGLLATGQPSEPPAAVRPAARVWSRIELAPGVELSVAAEASLSVETMRRLADAVRSVLDERGEGHA
ncbi:MAG: MerR family transcriptional regulator [Armatimonadetes bacterium]|nr:MerR family transcriptional regulator [Armatimonadota bacterium]